METDFNHRLMEAGNLYAEGSRSWVFGTSDECRPWIEWGGFLFKLGRYREAVQRFEEG
jgi:hypothetical protein